ncbi:MAG: ABC transporter ATP-binding protein [Coriobacteriia bacterium]|nr:ABC transporter ATP-binding protein [Coriobacteriia bacterium]
MSEKEIRAGRPGAGCAGGAPLLEIENLRVSYPSVGGVVRAVRGVTFSVAAGQTCALVGESGCGKSVSAKAVMGLVRAPGLIEPGSIIRFDGTNVLGFSERQWCDFRGRDCALIFQDALASLNPTMRVGRQLIEALDNHCPELSASEKRRRAIETLRLTEIPDPEACMRRYPHELSGGMRQRVMIASAMVARPRLLIADEPTTSLDVTVQQQTLQLMGDLQRQFGTAVLLITHDLGIVADVADRVVVMYAGRIVEQGPRDNIFYRPAHPYTEALLASVPRLDAPAKQGLRAIEGTLPDPTSEPTGCAFCERCPHAMRICAQEMPATVELAGETAGGPAAGETAAGGQTGTGGLAATGGRHEVTCWLHDPRYLAAGTTKEGR